MNDGIPGWGEMTGLIFVIVVVVGVWTIYHSFPSLTSNVTPPQVFIRKTISMLHLVIVYYVLCTFFIDRPGGSRNDLLLSLAFFL